MRGFIGAGFQIEANLEDVLCGRSFAIVVKTTLVETSILSIVTSPKRIESMRQARIVTEHRVKAIVDFFGIERSRLVVMGSKGCRVRVVHGFMDGVLEMTTAIGRSSEDDCFCCLLLDAQKRLLNRGYSRDVNESHWNKWMVIAKSPVDVACEWPAHA